MLGRELVLLWLLHRLETGYLWHSATAHHIHTARLLYLIGLISVEVVASGSATTRIEIKTSFEHVTKIAERIICRRSLLLLLLHGRWLWHGALIRHEIELVHVLLVH